LHCFKTSLRLLTEENYTNSKSKLSYHSKLAFNEKQVVRFHEPESIKPLKRIAPSAHAWAPPAPHDVSDAIAPPMVWPEMAAAQSMSTPTEEEADARCGKRYCPNEIPVGDDNLMDTLAHVFIKIIKRKSQKSKCKSIL
jgi:hypothetical protein